MQLRTMMASFAVDHPVPDDLVVTDRSEFMLDAAVLEDELAYTRSAVQFKRHHVQVVQEDGKGADGKPDVSECHWALTSSVAGVSMSRLRALIRHTPDG
jgi:hypothetical protein